MAINKITPETIEPLSDKEVIDVITSTLDSVLVVKQLYNLQDRTETEEKSYKDNKEHVISVADRLVSYGVDDIVSAFRDPENIDIDNTMFAPYKRAFNAVSDTFEEEREYVKEDSLKQAISATYRDKIKSKRIAIAGNIFGDLTRDEYIRKEVRAKEAAATGNYDIFEDAAKIANESPEQLVEAILAAADTWHDIEDNMLFTLGALRAKATAELAAKDFDAVTKTVNDMIAL